MPGGVGGRREQSRLLPDHAAETLTDLKAAIWQRFKILAMMPYRHLEEDNDNNLSHIF